MTVETITTERLALVSLPVEALEALLDGRRTEVEQELAIAIPAGWPDDHDANFLRFRAQQMRDGTQKQEWLVRAVCLREPRLPMIGNAGFHGVPGTNAKRVPDAVELGYRIFEEHRRRGYATEVVRALLEWAQGRGIRHFVLSIAPDNDPSLAIARRLGFTETGSHWDEDDGEELEFELELGADDPASN